MKTIFFDLDDTLYKTPIKECNEILIMYTAQKYGLSVEIVRNAFEEGKAVTKKMLVGVAASHNRLLYIQHMLEILEKSVILDTLEIYNVFWDSFLQKIFLRRGVKQVLEQLKIDGYNVGICTDLTAHIQHRKLQILDLSKYVDWLVTSEEAGAEKPSEKIFRLCSYKSQCDIRDIIYVGDDYEKDFIGASKVGMKAFLYQENLYPDFYMFYKEKLKPCI